MSNRIKLKPTPGRTAPGRLAQAPGTPVWKRITPLLLAFAAGALLAGPIGAAVADPRSDTQQAIDKLREADAKRDAQQIVELTDQARRIKDQLTPVLDGLAKALPPGGAAPGPTASAADVTQWRETTKKAVEEFASPPSAGTGVNIARSGLSAAVKSLDQTVAAYQEALNAPAPNQPGLFAVAARQRDTSISVWSVGATQLDQLNVDSGNGHAHVFLPAVPGQGAMTADGAQEGK